MIENLKESINISIYLSVYFANEGRMCVYRTREGVRVRQRRLTIHDWHERQLGEKAKHIGNAGIIAPLFSAPLLIPSCSAILLHTRNPPANMASPARCSFLQGSLSF